MTEQLGDVPFENGACPICKGEQEWREPEVTVPCWNCNPDHPMHLRARLAETEGELESARQRVGEFTNKLAAATGHIDKLTKIAYEAVEIKAGCDDGMFFNPTNIRCENCKALPVCTAVAEAEHHDCRNCGWYDTGDKMGCSSPEYEKCDPPWSYSQWKPRDAEEETPA